MPPRRAGAPRLIDWTGERCVPWAPNVQVIYEHYHRYLWARALVGDRRVLDLGSGEGFGAALLADAARTVVGIDLDETTVEHSRLNYAGPGLEFRVASATDLADFRDDAFDAVVAFEVIEHIRDQEAVLAEVARVLAPGGLLIISTPDRRAYSEETGQVNPFHEKELTQDELRGLLSRHFRSMELFAQRTATGSRIEALGAEQDGRHLDLHIERVGDDWRVGGPISPLYLIAVASDGELPQLISGSSLSDFGLELRREVEYEQARGALALKQATQAAHSAAAESERLAAELASRTRELDAERLRTGGVAGPAAAEETSVLWALLEGARRRFYSRIGGRESRLGRAVGATLRLIGQLMRKRARVARRWAELTLPQFEDPEVSIVIPVHSGADLTERCLHAIVASSGDVAYEVVLVDDASDTETKALLAAVRGARQIVNGENLGYLRSVNRGAASARGRNLVLLNNDTEPQPGWLEAFVERAESADDVGVVTAKLVYPDGALQEAGGIVWRDGVPWNFGRGRDVRMAEYNYAREVDYGSAAALLVRAEVWQAAGGFDERFVPGYFEDADLCFTARALGWRVMYEPKAVVLHVEGGSMGVDESAGLKRFQEINRPKFVEKWHDALQEQPGNASLERAHMASDRRRGPCVLVVDHHVPTPDRDAGSLRMWHILEGLLEMGCRVTFLPDDSDPMEPYTSRLQGMGVEMLVGPVVVPERVAGLGARLELALLSRPYVAARYMHTVREHAPEAVVAYDTVDLHFVREQRRLEHARGGNPRVSDAFRELEGALARTADVTLVVSEEERRHLLGIAPDAEVEIVPLANEIATDVPGPEHRSGLLFLGGFQHTPNVDAADYMAREVMPRVWRVLPEATLTLVGSHAPPEVTSLAGPNIVVAGWVEDLDPLLRESLVMVAPVRYGAGMKGKVTHSLAAGLPVVTTTIGAEGLDVTDGRELLIADDPETFASRIVDLHRDPELWLELSSRGQALAERVCAPSVQHAALRRLLERRLDAGEGQARSAMKTSCSPPPR
jgi:GT2 family glycosyltransferase/SAM-dependent methyltransferase